MSSRLARSRYLDGTYSRRYSILMAVLTRSSLGFFGIHDPGPPPLGFACSRPEDASAFWIPCAAKAEAVAPASLPVSDDPVMPIEIMGEFTARSSTIQQVASPTLLPASITFAILSTHITTSKTTYISSKSSKQLVALDDVSRTPLSSRPTATDIVLNSGEPPFAISPEGSDSSSTQRPNVSEGKRAAIISGAIFAIGVLVAIILCSLRRRRQRAKSPDFGPSMAATSTSRASFDGYSVEVPPSGSETRLVLAASYATDSSRGRESKPPLRLAERRLLPLVSRNNSPHGSQNTKSSAEQVDPGLVLIRELLGSRAASSHEVNSLVDAGAAEQSETPGTSNLNQVDKMFQTWPLSMPPPALFKNNSSSNTSLRGSGSCSTPPPSSPLPRLPNSPPGSPPPTSPLALMVSPPSSPRRPSAAATATARTNPFLDP